MNYNFAPRIKKYRKTLDAASVILIFKIIDKINRIRESMINISSHISNKVYIGRMKNKIGLIKILYSSNNSGIQLITKAAICKKIDYFYIEKTEYTNN